MEKLDRLVWAEAASFKICDLRVNVRSNSIGAMAQLVSHVPLERSRFHTSDEERLYSLIAPPTRQRRNLREFHFLYRDAERIGRAAKIEELSQSFETDLSLHVGEHASDYLFIHAGVVGWKGRGILFPGASCSGKSELVREFLRAGADYYSDEFAVLTHDGRVRPYARALSFREKGRPATLRLTAEELGATTGRKPLPVRLIVLTSFQYGGQWRPECLSHGMGMLRTLEHTIAVRTKPKLAFSILSRVVHGAETLTSVRGEARDTLSFIVKHLECSV